jgi:uncharacterized protein
MLQQIWHAFEMAFLMGWEIFWALVLGFGLSAIIQAFVPKGQMSKLLPDSSPTSLAIACGLGAASSSCSYAAVALTRSLVRKGANFIAAMGFQLASTNLVIELSLLLIVLLGWQFAVSEFLGGIILVGIMAALFRRFVTKQLVANAVQQADRNLLGKMEGHALMDMTVTDGPLLKRIFSKKGFTAISHYFIMDWAAIWKDIVAGLLIAGALAAWVPHDFWTAFFLQNHPILTKFWGPFIGPMVAIFSFVCSVGNIPLAAVLWNGGISFGGVISFIFADLIILPILHIYWKYYGFKMMMAIFVIYYVAMVTAALIIEFIFQLFHLVPQHSNAKIIETSIHFNYTAGLNILFGLIAVILLLRFFKTGGLHMLSMMDKPIKHH